MAIQFCETRYASYELNNANKRGREKENMKGRQRKKRRRTGGLFTEFYRSSNNQSKTNYVTELLSDSSLLQISRDIS